jgi:hypothetical protein
MLSWFMKLGCILSGKKVVRSYALQLVRLKLHIIRHVKLFERDDPHHILRCTVHKKYVSWRCCSVSSLLARIFERHRRRCQWMSITVKLPSMDRILTAVIGILRTWMCPLCCLIRFWRASFSYPTKISTALRLTRRDWFSIILWTLFYLQAIGKSFGFWLCGRQDTWHICPPIVSFISARQVVAAFTSWTEAVVGAPSCALQCIVMRTPVYRHAHSSVPSCVFQCIVMRMPVYRHARLRRALFS